MRDGCWTCGGARPGPRGSIVLNSNNVPGSGTIINRAGSVFDNSFNGSMVTQNFGAADNGADALFTNLGTFQQDRRRLQAIRRFRAPVRQPAALVEVQAGTLNIAGGGTHSGSFSTAAGTTLQFGGGTHNLNNASAVSSLGRLLVSGGTVNTTGTLASGGLLEMTGGALNAGGAINTASYILSAGTLSGTGDLTVSGATTLSGGTMTGSGDTITLGSLTINRRHKPRCGTAAGRARGCDLDRGADRPELEQRAGLGHDHQPCRVGVRQQLQRQHGHAELRRGGQRGDGAVYEPGDIQEVRRRAAGRDLDRQRLRQQRNRAGPDRAAERYRHGAAGRHHRRRQRRDLAQDRRFHQLRHAVGQRHVRCRNRQHADQRWHDRARNLLGAPHLQRPPAAHGHERDRFRAGRA